MTARFTYTPIVAKLGQPIHFIDLSDRSPTSWLWTFYDLDGVTVLGTSTLQNPYFTFPTADPTHCYRVTLAVSETGIPTSPPPVFPPGPPPPTFPPTDPPDPGLPSDDPPVARLAGRTLTHNHDFTIVGAVEDYGWYRNDWRSNRNGELQNWSPDRVYLDGGGVHLVCSYIADETTNRGSHYRFGMIENVLDVGPGLMAFAIDTMPKFDPGMWVGPWAVGINGPYEIDIAEDPSLDPTHYFVTLHSPNWPSQAVLGDVTSPHVYAVDWTDTYIQFLLDWYVVESIVDPATVASMSAARMMVLLQTAIGGTWPNPPDGTTDAFLGGDPELVCRWFRRWA